MTPGRLLDELRHDPEQWAVQVAEVRAYARAYHAMHAAKDDSELDQRDPVLQRVKRTQATILRGA